MKDVTFHMLRNASCQVQYHYMSQFPGKVNAFDVTLLSRAFNPSVVDRLQALSERM